MSLVAKAWAFLFAIMIIATAFLIFSPEQLFARNINEYKDTLSDSNPSGASNHILSFKLNTTISPSSYLEVTMPAGFQILSTSTFAAERNVELYVNGVPRVSDIFADASTDKVEIFSGSPGSIKYTLNSTTGITSGSQIQLKIGNNTSKALQAITSYSTTTGTTTSAADIKPIINDSATGTKKVLFEIYDGGLVADAGFLIVIIDQVNFAPIDTSELIPPVRFNGAPSTTITGVTLNVEIFVETNELAICKYGLVPDVDYYSMSNTFSNTGLIYHTQVVAVTPDSTQIFYVRCIDDEDNFNTDDYLIQFYVTEVPVGEINTEGGLYGDGTGSGNSGTGTGGGSGGTSGSADGEAPETGGSAGSGGSGGGAGGGVGPSSGGSAGGGFESISGPYRSGDARVIISGYAYPRSTVYALVDGNAVTNERADAQGKYSITIDAIARGVYTFGVYAVDSNAVKSSTFSTSFTVTGARTSALSNINLTPTVKVSPDPVDPGSVLTISGYSIVNADIFIESENNKTSANKQSLTTVSDSDGAWSTTMSTAGFSVGTYKIRAKAVQIDGLSTNFSNYTLYGVGQTAVKQINADLNRDGKVNLTDFSILLFWWNTDGGTSDPSADINSDGRVSLTDFSILLFNWTG